MDKIKLLNVMLMLNIHSGKALLQRCQLEGEHLAPVYLTMQANSNHQNRKDMDFGNCLKKYLYTVKLPRNYERPTFFEVVSKNVRILCLFAFIIMEISL